MRMEVPGLVHRRRKDGSVAVYWIAKNCSRRAAAYALKSVRLHCSAEEQVVLARKLYGELQIWLAGEMDERPPLRFEGTISSLVENYERHELSPYRSVKWNTRDSYEVSLKTLRKAVGARALKNIAAID